MVSSGELVRPAPELFCLEAELFQLYLLNDSTRPKVGTCTKLKPPRRLAADRACQSKNFLLHTARIGNVGIIAAVARLQLPGLEHQGYQQSRILSGLEYQCI